MTALTTTREFLTGVITTPAGYFSLCTRNGGAWTQHWYEWPSQLDQIATMADDAAPTQDVYFSTYLFSQKDSHKQHVLPSRTIQQDLDEAPLERLSITPTAITSTSPGRHQAYWVLQTYNNVPLDLDAHELISKRLCYATPGCDISGWPLGRKVRVPGTMNHKYGTPTPVGILSFNLGQLTKPEDLELLPDIVPAMLTVGTDGTLLIEDQPTVFPMGPHELLETVKDLLPPKVVAEYATPMGDRSKALWALMVAAFRAGLPREAVYWLALHSSNNKFLGLAKGAHRELAKDVVRAELFLLAHQVDTKALIDDVRRAPKMRTFEKHREISSLVTAAMKSEGRFVQTYDERRYYVPSDPARPIPVEPMSPRLNSVLDLRYTVNRADSEWSHVVNSLESYAGTLPPHTKRGVLTEYDPTSNVLWVHGGRQYVYKVSAYPAPLTRQMVGDNGIIFEWNSVVEPFVPMPPLPSDAPNGNYDWGRELFGNLENVVGMTPDQALAILKTWVMFMLLRSEARTRPLLALLGQPGSGKTTTAHRLYTWLYGRHTDISAITSPDKFDFSVATLPLVAMDNLDTWERWVPDRLAQAMSNTDIMSRKLWTNTEVSVLKRQAMLCVTAHNPTFVRPDVVDRLLVMSFVRFDSLGLKFAAEGEIFSRLLEQRNHIWWAILQDMSRVLATARPIEPAINLRVEDFAALGEWITRPTGMWDDFKEGVNLVVVGQKNLTVESDQLFFDVLRRWLEATQGGAHQYKTPEQLWDELVSCAQDGGYQKKYQGPQNLDKKLWVLQDTLRSLPLHINWRPTKGSAIGRREWQISTTPPPK